MKVSTELIHSAIDFSASADRLACQYLKGIYILESSPTLEDMYWICRVRGVFDQVTVAFCLSSKMTGKDYSKDISRIRKLLNHSQGVCIDFYRAESLGNFLDNSQKIAEVVRGENGEFLGTREVKSDISRLIIPGNKPESFSAVNFPKYYF